MKKCLLLPLVVLLVIASSQAAAAQDVELLLFGGAGHKVFLGCLNCSKYDSDSIWNKFGTYGSRYNPNSIWNKYGTYGSKYNAASPWNKYSSDPPVVTDSDGNFYGYFSANRFVAKRTTIDLLVKMLDNCEWLVDNIDEVRDGM